MKVLPIAGTHASRREAEWTDVKSPFFRHLAVFGVENIAGIAAAPFVWSTDLDFSTGHHEDWIAGGAALYYYLVPVLRPELRLPPAETFLIVHSHGLAVALYACASGLKVNRLISVGSPVRADMADVAARARPNIGAWLHLYSNSDWWQLLGSIGDKHLGIVRKHPLADRNELVPAGIGHGDLLRDEARFHLWQERGWLPFLLEGAGAPSAGV